MSTGRRITGAALIVAALLFVGARVALSADPAPPPKDLIDSPIPPGQHPVMKPDPGDGPPPIFWPALHLTDGPYCVSVGIGAERLGHVDTMHSADRGNLDTVRGSIANAYRIVAFTYEGKCTAAAAKIGGPGQAERVTACKGTAALLRAKADAGVRFAGEPDPGALMESAFHRVDGDGGPVSCTCATYYGSDVVPGGACGGPCGGCWYCR